MKNKILVIEDDRAISELLCMNLEAAGYETVAAYDGEEAQRLLLWHEDADMAVVDIMLPGKDGFALMDACYLITELLLYLFLQYTLVVESAEEVRSNLL